MPGSIVRPFIDTNVLVYLASGDRTKADRAEEILKEGGTISVQVLNEFASVARRKLGMTWSETHVFLSTFREVLTVVPMTEEIHVAGLALAERYRLSVYDGMIVAAALDAGCDVVLSEDMQDGLIVDGRLVIRNPLLGI
ncbi:MULTISPECIES: PIN domain-containing protein [unclassified Mesorhizobium]|uniref:PIN domain-containing protein n=1 Tax=unclassified Mesorhizobium TaxID=325217 RepID=UPI003014E9FE